MTSPRCMFTDFLVVCFCAVTFGRLNPLNLELSLGGAGWSAISEERTLDELPQPCHRTCQGKGSPPGIVGKGLIHGKRPLKVSAGVDDESMKPSKSAKLSSEFPEQSDPNFISGSHSELDQQYYELQARDEDAQQLLRFAHLTSDTSPDPSMFHERSHFHHLSRWHDSLSLPETPLGQHSCNARHDFALAALGRLHTSSGNQNVRHYIDSSSKPLESDHATMSAWGNRHDVSDTHHDVVNIYESESAKSAFSSPDIPVNLAELEEKGTRLKELDLQPTELQEANQNVTAAQKAALQTAKPREVSSQTEKLEILYAWIGSMPSQVDGSYNNATREAKTRLFFQLKQVEEAQISRSHTNTGQRYDFIKHEVELEARLFCLLENLYCINQRVLRIFLITPAHSVYEDEQRRLFEWMASLDIPVEASLHSASVLDASQVCHLRVMMKCVLGLKENPVVFSIRKGEKVTEISLNDHLMGKFAVNILGYYYKSRNIEKWEAIFPRDVDFVKLLAKIRRQSLIRNYCNAKADIEFFTQYLPIPWQQSWGEEKYKCARETNPLKRLFRAPIQDSLENLPKHFLSIEWAPGEEGWLEEPEFLFEVSSNELTNPSVTAAVRESRNNAPRKQLEHDKRFNFQVLNVVPFGQDEPRKMHKVDPKIYAWIGCMEDRVGTDMDEILRGIKHQLKSKLRLEQYAIGSKIKTAVVSEVGPNLPALNTREVTKKDEKSQHADEQLNIKSVALHILPIFKKVLSLNGLVLENFGVVHTDGRFIPQQQAICNWLLEKILSILVRDESRETVEDKKKYSWRELVASFLENNEEEVMAQFRLRKSRPKVRVGRIQQLKTQVAVWSLGSYYKSLNPDKWCSLFSSDVEFIKFFLLLRKRRINSKYHGAQVIEKYFYEKAHPIPWEDTWTKSKVEYVMKYNPMKKLYGKSLETWLENIGE